MPSYPHQTCTTEPTEWDTTDTEEDHYRGEEVSTETGGVASNSAFKSLGGRVISTYPSHHPSLLHTLVMSRFTWIWPGICVSWVCHPPLVLGGSFDRKNPPIPIPVYYIYSSWTIWILTCTPQMIFVWKWSPVTTWPTTREREIRAWGHCNAPCVWPNDFDCKLSSIWCTRGATCGRHLLW